MKQLEIAKTCTFLTEHAKKIIYGIPEESVAIYSFLKTEFRKGNIYKNDLFKFVYSSYYDMDNNTVNERFKKKYFKLMETNRHGVISDFKIILDILYCFNTYKKFTSIEFSLTSALFHMIDPKYPIYDENTCELFEFRVPRTNNYTSDYNAFIACYSEMQDTYNTILEYEMLGPTLYYFKKRFPNNELCEKALLNFIFSSAVI